MYKQLLVKHFENSAPKVLRLPIPPHLRGILAAILIIHNPQYPRHFLNGCYFILEDGDLTPFSEGYDSNPVIENSLLSQIHCCDERWRQLETWNSPPYSQHLPLTFTSRFFGWSWEPRFTHPNALLSEGASLIMSLKPTCLMKIHATLQCYITQISSKSRIIDGSEYFCSQYPAKKALGGSESTVAWVCGDSTEPIGYIQYISLENDKDGLQVLITGLAVEEPYRRRGFARGLILSVICLMSHCKEIWIAVGEENQAALCLYLKCGFVTRKKQWESYIKVTVP
ncbi:hypothetical protein HYPSUDRAFT_41896 [Hypholoma sublateritium FD-334 SS-4]|uniref:N-acetyltransferase domain-containing protein n=1 Tax=Hypholoma sublateritium (strain FD-334 SS-4) TaxID=945553 RepID=A0A0D2NRV6_HYPSF|nr:hypothetical protein HYPSUDRAFT_41896 [Hypholoma sublateritium FD-334 SS-4]